MNPISKIYINYEQYVYPQVKELRGATRLLYTLQSLAQIGIKKIHEEQEPIYEKEWDNLIILDACRHDTYQKVAGEANYQISVGSMSKEFIQKTFSDHDFSDTVLITANPYCHESHFKQATGKKPGEVFHTVFHTYQDEWDVEEQTVLAESVVENAKTAEKLFPDKKKIVWFMQPHLPFVNSDLSDFSFRQAIIDSSEGDKVWDMAMKGEISRQQAIEGYEKNLEYVLPYARELGEELDGQTVLTADHGTFLGENGLYKHPKGSKAEVLRKVPWDEL